MTIDVLWLPYLISTPEKNKHNRREDKKRRPTVNIEQTKKDKNINIENPELEERYQDIIVTIKKKPPPKKKVKSMAQEIMQKFKWKEKMPQQLQKLRTHLLKL